MTSRNGRVSKDECMDLTFLQGKKVLITGGTGFIGRSFVEVLGKAGVDLRITVHDRPSPYGQMWPMSFMLI